ncbi:MAG: GTP cyclohydrolase I [Polyangiales bacterium]
MPASIDDAAKAIGDFLTALGLSPAGDPELAGTRARRARLGRRAVDGYATDFRARALLGGALASEERSMVAVLDLDHASVCPHHLMPVQGRAHVATSGGRIVGLGVIAQLVDALSHRLVLQDPGSARRVADALVTHLARAPRG